MTLTGSGFELGDLCLCVRILDDGHEKVWVLSVGRFFTAEFWELGAEER